MLFYSRAHTIRTMNLRNLLIRIKTGIQAH